MSTQEQTQQEIVSQIANRLVELCSNGQFDTARTELFANSAVSIEPDHLNQPVAEGLAAIEAKGLEFQNSIAENHGGYVGQPVIAGNHFAIPMGMDVTLKDGGRMQMHEIAVYKVADGKIVSEQFFY